MKKIVAAVLILCMCAGCIVPIVWAEEAVNSAPYQPQFAEYADVLHALGLFSGTEAGYELENAPTRIQATVMLIRLLGKEEEALAETRQHPFIDVPAWGDRYVGYAYGAGLTKGYSPWEFGSNILCDAKMYLTFLLRALEYSDANNDFTYNKAVDFSETVKLISLDYMRELDSRSFYRDDMVRCSYLALLTKMKTTERRFYDYYLYPARLLEVLDDNDAVNKDAAQVYMDSILYDVLSYRTSLRRDWNVELPRPNTTPTSKSEVQALTFLRRLSSTAAPPSPIMQRPYTIESWRANIYDKKAQEYVQTERTVRHFREGTIWITALDDPFGLMDMSNAFDMRGRDYFLNGRVEDRATIPFARYGYWRLNREDSDYRFDAPIEGEHALEILENYTKSEDGRALTVTRQPSPNSEVIQLLIADTFFSHFEGEFSDADYRHMTLDVTNISMTEYFFDTLLTKKELTCDVVVNIRGTKISLHFVCASDTMTFTV